MEKYREAESVATLLGSEPKTLRLQRKIVRARTLKLCWKILLLICEKLGVNALMPFNKLVAQ